MRLGSANWFFRTDARNDFRPKAKSLFQNILLLSPCGSRFYADPISVPLRKSLRINHFPTTDFRIEFELEAKSLFQNILPISPCGSRFCGDSPLSPSHKCLRMNILGIWTTKKEYAQLMAPILLSFRSFSDLWWLWRSEICDPIFRRRWARPPTAHRPKPVVGCTTR